MWSSLDGATWVEEGAGNTVGWNARSSHASAVFGDKIWVIGGENDDNPINSLLWDSNTNGQNWTKGTNYPRAFSIDGFKQKAVEYKNRLWIFGPGGVWSSATPANGGWTRESFPARDFPVLVFKNRLWLLGYHRARVWNMTGPGS